MLVENSFAVLFQVKTYKKERMYPSWAPSSANKHDDKNVRNDILKQIYLGKIISSFIWLNSLTKYWLGKVCNKVI